MSETGKIYDIAIIGGGISGLGMAYEASNCGFECLLLEKAAFGSATSANSLRIIHGGLRYLQNLSLSRSINSIRAQNELLKKYPQIIKPLPCVYPLSGQGLKKPLPMAVATFIYRNLYKYAAREKINCKVVSKKFVESEIPLLKGSVRRGALFWTDALLLDPQALINSLASESKDLGAVLEEGSEVIEVNRSASGLFTITTRSDREAQQYQSRTVVNMSGPWIDQTNIRLAINRDRIPHSWCRAFNVIIAKQIDPKYAIAVDSLRKSDKRRAFFCVPRDGHSVIGTEYLQLGEGEDRSLITDSEVHDFLSDFSEALPNAKVSERDIVSVEAGILPVERIVGEKIKLVGKEHISDTLGYQEVLSTKYTTFLVQARNALRHAAKWLPN